MPESSQRQKPIQKLSVSNLETLWTILRGRRISPQYIHMSWVFVNSLGSTFLDPGVRVSFVHSSRTSGLGQRSRGLIGIGSGVGWVSAMAGRRQDDLCSP